MFDEPVNGLDPEGVWWIRKLLRSLAAEGRTVFLSSHLMSEMALTADRLIIIGRGRLIAATSVADFLSSGSDNHVRVRTPQSEALARLLRDSGAAVMPQPDDTLRVTGATAEDIGQIARSNGITLQELSAQQVSLEQRYLELTGDAVDYRTAAGTTAPARN
jgi:ABC-2 type transport system ATP-binding protein